MNHRKGKHFTSSIVWEIALLSTDIGSYKGSWGQQWEIALHSNVQIERIEVETIYLCEAYLFINMDVSTISPKHWIICYLQYTQLTGESEDKLFDTREP